MKKLVALLLCLALSIALSGCGKSEQQESSPSASAQQSGSAAVEDEEFNVPEGYELKVAFAENNAPYSYVDGGEVVGVDVDIAKDVCEKNGWTLNAQAVDWSDSKSRMDLLSNGTVDCFWGSVPYQEVNESEIMWNSYGSIYVDATVLDGAGYYKLEDLKGKSVEVEPGSMFALEGESATELGKQLHENAAKVEQVSDAQTAYQDLAAGKCDAIVVSGAADDRVVFDDFDVVFMAVYDEDVYSEESDDSSDGELAGVEANSICDLELGAGFKEDTDVYFATAVTMDALVSDGTVSGILDDWAGKDNGVYADAISRCALYQTEEFSEEQIGDLEDGSGSIDWSVLEDWDDEEADTDESVTDITLEEDTEPTVTVVK